MPKAARRQSGPKVAVRAEPYPTIKPGDKPSPLAANNIAGVKESAAAPKKPAVKRGSRAKNAGAKAVVKEESEDVFKSAKAAPEITTKKVSKGKVAKGDAVPKEEESEATKGNPANEKPAGTYFDIELESGNSENETRIYDTCSEVRRKIHLLLSKDNKNPEDGIPGEFKKDGTPKPYTKAALCAKLGVSSGMMDTFMKAPQMMGGAESPVYPAAYKFFERKRIFEGKSKTAGRLKVEADRPDGLPFRDPNKMRLTLGPGENFEDFVDEYGQ